MTSDLNESNLTGGESAQPTRKERERMARRQLIVDAALKVFAYKGFSDAKLEDVAELAEFGKATLYSYFPTKEALFQNVLETSFSRVRAITEEAFTGDEPFERKLARFISEAMGHFYHNPESMRLMMSESHQLRGANPMLRLMPDLLAIITSSIEREQKRKVLMTDAAPMDLAMLLLNMLFGQYMARIYRNLCKEHEENVRDEKSMQAFLERMRSSDLETEIASAISLIHRVYLHGTMKSTSSSSQNDQNT